MKKSIKTDGTARIAKAIAAQINHISYVERLEIRHFDDNRKCSMIVDQETVFSGERAIDCRKNAFVHAFQLLQDAETDGKLCSYHLDSPLEAQFKQMKNFTALSIEIDVLDNKIGDRMTISEGDFLDQPDEYLGECVAELMWYKEYGYAVDGWEDTVWDEYDEECEILGFNMDDVFDIISDSQLKF